MKVLLDTQIIIWAVRDRKKLSPQVVEILSSDEYRLVVSIASLWEASIKMSIGKLEMPESFVEDTVNSDITILPIMSEHLKFLRTLPHHHKDPFDRMLIAQALHENITLITTDAFLTKYDPKIILA